MTSKVSNSSFSIKSLSQATRNNRLTKPPASAAAAGQPPLRKLSKTISDCSTKSESTATTEQEFRVRFSEKVRIRKALSHKDYTPEEIQACWYNGEENQRIRRNCKKEIRKMNEGCKVKDNNCYCPPGLEGHTTVGTATRRRNRELAINAVLDEQMIQWEGGIYDEESIADIYCRASYSCQQKAIVVGRRGDYGETEAYLESCSRIESGALAFCAA
jgi:hypothetical protein